MPKSFVDKYYDSWASSPGNRKKIKEENDKEETENSSISPSMNFLQRHFGPTFGVKKSRKDIDLPMSKNGKKDPRLKTKFDEVKEGYGMFRKLMEKK